MHNTLLHEINNLVLNCASHILEMVELATKFIFKLTFFMKKI
jgi:hypothetical protein